MDRIYPSALAVAASAKISRTLGLMGKALPDALSFPKKRKYIGAFAAAALVTTMPSSKNSLTVTPNFVAVPVSLSSSSPLPVPRRSVPVTPSIPIGLPDPDFNLERCRDAALAARTGEEEQKVDDAFVAAWTAICVAAPATERLTGMQPNAIPTAQQGHDMLDRAYRLASAENLLVGRVPASSQFAVRQAVRWVSAHPQDILEKSIDAAAYQAAVAAQTPDKSLNMQHLFSNVVFHPAREFQNIYLTYDQVVLIATVYQNEADIVVGGTPETHTIGIENCAAVTLNRLATGQFGTLTTILNIDDFESIKRHDGVDNLYEATPQSIAAVKEVIEKRQTFGNALYFNNRTVDDQRISKRTGRSTNVWLPYTKIGEVGTAPKSHQYDNGIIQRGALLLYEVPKYNIIINGHPQRPVNRAVVDNGQIESKP